MQETMAIRSEPEWRSSAMTVLLAEGHTAMRSLLARSLRRSGIEVLEAESGLDLLGLLDRGLATGELVPSQTAIVSNVRMRRVDGLHALETVHRLHLRIPVVLISEFVNDETRRLAADLGACALLSKPFRISTLIERLRRLAQEP